MCFTDNPVRDAERYAYLQDKHAELCRIGECAHCGEELHDYDEHYDFDGILVCDECLIDWAKNYKAEV